MTMIILPPTSATPTCIEQRQESGSITVQPQQPQRSQPQPYDDYDPSSSVCQGCFPPKDEGDDEHDMNTIIERRLPLNYDSDDDDDDDNDKVNVHYSNNENDDDETCSSSSDETSVTGCAQRHFLPISRRPTRKTSDIIVSPNLVINPSGKEGFRGWRRLTVNDSWQVETSAVPLANPSLTTATTTKFVSTHFWCIMEQTVDITEIVMESLNDDVRGNPVVVQVSARFMAHAECPSVFRLSATQLDKNGHVVPHTHQSTGILSAPRTFWDTATLDLTPTPTTRAVKITVYGKDGRFMRGHYGAKVTDISVRIIHTIAANKVKDVTQIASE